MSDVFFLIAKIGWALISPANLLVVLLVLATLLVWLRIRGGLLLLLLVTLSVIPVWWYPVGDVLLYPLETRFKMPLSAPTDVDGIIVLGGGEDYRQSRVWQQPQLGEGGERFLTGATLARDYPTVPVIYSGGSPLINQPDNGEMIVFASQLFQQSGLDPKRLMLETSSRNTAENFRELRAILPNADGHYLLVTSAFHMPRAMGVAQSQGLNITAYPVDYRSAPPDKREFKADFLEHLTQLDLAVREWIGLLAYYLTDRTATLFPTVENANTDAD